MYASWLIDSIGYRKGQLIFAEEEAHRWKSCAVGNLHTAGQIGKALGFLEANVKAWMDWREKNPRYSRAWGWVGSGRPRPRGVPVKGKKS